MKIGVFAEASLPETVTVGEIFSRIFHCSSTPDSAGMMRWGVELFLINS
jgi:hypothetical protein